jgi:hypothetical protein
MLARRAFRPAAVSVMDRIERCRARDYAMRMPPLRRYAAAFWVGFLEGQRANEPARAVEKFLLAIDLDLDAPLTMRSSQ